MTMLVAGLVKTGFEADSAVQHLLDLAYAREDISLIMSDETLHRHFAMEGMSRPMCGSGIGGALVTAIAAITAVGTSVTVPGLGLVMAGPLAATLANGLRGGIISALVRVGIPEYRARIYELGLSTGLILVGVHARSSANADRVEQVFEDLGAAQVRIVASSRRPLESYI